MTELNRTVLEELDRLDEECDPPHPTRPYQHISSQHSWTLPGLVSDPFVEVTGGIWIKKTVSRVQKPPQSQTRPSGIPWDPLVGNDEIRVLLLEPGAFSDPLRGRLVTVSLSTLRHKDKYEAISYLWGESSDTYDTLHFPNGTLGLRENLTHALRHLRLESTARRLWIDALCINQEDFEEKTQQIPLMGTIYEKASRVVIWLGLATEHTELGFEMLHHFLKLRSGRRIWPCSELPPNSVARALEDVLSRRYFTRIWTVQEGALARKILMICGAHSIEWANEIPEVLPFIRSIKAATLMPQGEENGLGDVDFEPFLALLQMQLENGPDANRWNSRRRRADLLETMYSNRNRKAVMQIDKIYGVLGLVDKMTAAKIKADYTASTEDVYDHAGQVMLEETDAICAELLATSVPSSRMRMSPDRLGTTLSSRQDASMDEILRSNVEGMIESTCSQGLALMRSGNFDQAAELLQSAATMVRGQKWASPAANCPRGVENDDARDLPPTTEAPRKISPLARLMVMNKTHKLFSTPRRGGGGG